LGTALGNPCPDYPGEASAKQRLRRHILSYPLMARRDGAPESDGSAPRLRHLIAVTGTLINVASVLAGTLAGVLAGNRLPDGFRRRVLAGLGLVTLLLGVDSALAWRHTSPIIVLAAILLGALTGEAMGIERRLSALGDRLQGRLAGDQGGRGGGAPASSVSQAFFTASVLFCVGPLTVLGAIQDGLTGDYRLLATKSLLDGFASIAISATLGWGVGLAAFTVLVVQGGISLAAGLFEHALRGEALAALTSAGGILIIAIALKLLDVRDVKAGNFLPALVFAPLLVAAVHALR
jgi:uncharacterized membrane protein YqgA involved in biofilm formation